jgi:hypothetical protein
MALRGLSSMTKTVDLFPDAAVLLTDFDGNVRVLPVECLNAIIAGKKSITQIEDYDKIVPIIIMEWLSGINSY